MGPLAGLHALNRARAVYFKAQWNLLKAHDFYLKNQILGP